MLCVGSADDACGGRTSTGAIRLLWLQLLIIDGMSDVMSG